MSAKWCLNGYELGPATDTEVTVEQGSHSGDLAGRQDARPIPKGGQRTNYAGRGRQRLRVRFLITGSKPNIYQEAKRIEAAVEDQEVWTLEAPGGTGIAVYKDAARAAFRTRGKTRTLREGTSSVQVEVDAVCEGIWLTDGGDYYQIVAGWLRKTATGWVRDDGAVTTSGQGPRARVGQQQGGYPLGLRESDLNYAQPSLDTSTVINGKTWEDYDMAGFLHPAPVATDDVGHYELRSSLHDTFLDCITPTDEPAGDDELDDPGAEQPPPLPNDCNGMTITVQPSYTVGLSKP